MPRSTKLTALLVWLISILACNVPMSRSNAPASTQPQRPTATPPDLLTDQTSPSWATDLASFEASLREAVSAEDYASLQDMMSHAFAVSYTDAPGGYITSGDAIDLLKNDFLSGAEAVRFDDAVDPTVLAGVQLGPSDLQIARSLLSTGWGPASDDHAVLLISLDSQGQPYFSGILFARGGFSGRAAVTSSVPITNPAPTAAAGAAPSPNPAPRGSIIYQSNFPEGSWYTTDEPEVRGQHVAEGYQLEVFSWSAWVFSSRVNRSEFYAELTVQPQQCPGGQAGYALLFQRQDQQTFRWFMVRCSGEFFLHQQAGSGQGITLHEGRLPEGHDPATGEHRLGLLAQDNTLALYFDDIRLTAIGVNEMPQGDVGIYGEAGDTGPLRVVFTNLTVYEPQ